MIETIDRHVTEADYVADVRALQQKVWPTNVPREPRYPFGEVAITSYLRRWARERPDATAYIFYGREITFAELDDMSDRVASLLQRDGAGPGDRVAVYLGNCPQFVAIFFGILRAGAVHVPVNPMFKEHELAYELNDSGATIIIADHALMPMVRAVEGETALGAVYGTAIAALVPQAPSFPVPAAIESSARTSDATDLLAALSEVGEPAPVELELDAVAALNYTGGTTGMPKGCVHTQRDMIYTCATTVGVGLTLGPGDVLINFHPLFWIAGEDLGLLFPVFSGATCILLARWDAVGFMAAVDRYRANRVVMLVDNAVEVMDHVRSEAFDLSSIETTRVSSFVKKLNLEYRNRWRTLTGSTMVEASYGMTETHTCDTFTTGFQAEDYDLTLQPIFVGLPVPGTDIKICDFETGALQRLGEEGELCIRSPSNLKSYWNKPDATTEAIRDGWLHTGDIGVIDESGLVHFLGRRKEMLKVKGMSVFPAEIEALLGRHPVILGSGVIGREDADRGQVPVAFVVVDPAKRDEVTAEALDAWCREAMAVYKRPEIRIVDALPMTATGKVKKHELTAFL